MIVVRASVKSGVQRNCGTTWQWLCGIMLFNTIIVERKT